MTSTYLTNADFEGEHSSYSQPKSDRDIYLPNGWSINYTNGESNDMTSLNSGCTSWGQFSGKPQPTNGGSKTYWMRFRWGSTENITLSQETSANLPAGTYAVTVDAYSDDNTGTATISAAEVSQTVRSNGAWGNYTVVFTLASAQKVTVSLSYSNTGADDHVAAFDNVKILSFASEEAYNDYLREQNSLTGAAYNNPIVASFVTNGTFDSNKDGWTATGGFSNNQIKSSDDVNAGSMNTNKPWWENWNSSAKVNKMSQTINNIPNGTYRLDITAFVNNLADPNESQYVFANSDKTYLTEARTGVAYQVWTVVTSNQIEIGLDQTTATANWMGIDNVSLNYYGAGDVITAAQNASHKADWDLAKAAAEAARDDASYANVTGSERVTLLAEIAKAEPNTAEGYDDATAALTSATSAFTAAKTNYDFFVDNNTTLPYADSEKKPSITAESTAASIITALRAYYESNALAEGVAEAVDKTSLLTNNNNPSNTTGWTIINTDGNSNMRTLNNESYTDADGTSNHSYFDSNSWGAAFSTTFTQDVELPAGTYILTAKARGNGTSTYQVVADGKSTDISSIGNTGGVFGRGWNDYTVVFTLAAKKTVTLGINMVTGSSGNWLSFGDFRLVRTAFEAATSTEYDALNDAIATAEAKTLGFETGQYAPYNNVAALTALANAKALNQSVENAKSDVEALTEDLTGAAWTANVAEVNAFYDGNFAIQGENTTSPTALTGWNNPEGIRQLIKNTEANPGLNSASAKAAVFAWGGTTMTYGDTEGYTMPLAAHTIYELSFKTCGWRDGDMGYVNVDVKNASNEGLQTVTTKTATKRINAEDPWDEFRILFVTGEAGNYRLGMWTSKHTTFTDLMLKKATNQYLEFADNADMPNYAPGTYPTVKITRTLTANRWATAVYPFAVSGVDNIAVLDSYDSGTGILGFTSGASTANEPFLMRSTTNKSEISLSNVAVVATIAEPVVTKSEASLKGVYSATNITNAETNYVLSNNEIFSVGDAGAIINPYRAYIQIAGASARELTFTVDGETTAVEGIAANKQAEGATFNLNGQKVNGRLGKGIFIVNGKKTVVK